MEPLGDGEAGLDARIDSCPDVLREVADLGFVTPEDGTGVQSKVLVGEARIVIEQALEPACLACARCGP